ncbi:MAG: hypothetical protein HN353_00390 [Bdellovibrionales bacterium]|jgi:response regulator RpfG family c-di-GMP phosphodiesterase|nr:hypothetical protein [Bdellovibrionales bacterium]MBT3526408.1 hypothetical protein [Bdellovibrionales bacterium]MBT7669376.1 hypothetical protein [Bdellovibrionales bacterium]MBT7768128.1 hypothetical protein [Bdellovibrionales bacterium]
MSVNQDEEYLIIKPENLGGLELLPFNLYLYNPLDERYSVLLRANSPMGQEHRELITMLISKGASIAIKESSQRTFIKHTQTTSDEIPGMATASNSEGNESEEQDKDSFDLKQHLIPAIANNSFAMIIKQTRLELLQLPRHQSHTVSLASWLGENYLRGEESHTIKTAALAYQIAKLLPGMQDRDLLATLSIAAFIARLGELHIPREIVITPPSKDDTQSFRAYSNHIRQSELLLRQCGAQIDQQTIRIAAQHTEHLDGSGYPARLRGAAIAPLSLVLGATSELITLVEQAHNASTEDNSQVEQLLKNMQDTIFLTGLEKKFGDTISRKISYLLSDTVKGGMEAIAA